MRNLLSITIFIVAFVGLGLFAYTAFPRDLKTDAANTAAPLDVVSEFSKIAGAAPAAGGKYNALALVLDNGITSASALLANINSATGTTATQVITWEPGNGFVTYDPNDIFSTDFALKVGDPVFVLLEGTSTDVYSIVGDVPAQGTVDFPLTGTTGTCTYNFISIPLDTSASVNTASALIAEIGDVAQVLMYDPDNGFITYDPTDIFSTDFAVQIGYPYFVCMTASKTWP